MSRSTFILLTLLLALTAWNTWALQQQNDASSNAQAQGKAAMTRGESLEGEMRFGAAEVAYEHAALLARGADTLEARIAMLRVRALKHVATLSDPPGTAMDELQAIALELSSRGGANAEVGTLLSTVLLRADGNPVEAANRLRDIQEQTPEHPWAAWLLGVLDLRRGGLTDAIKNLELAVKRYPTFGAAHHQLGLAYASEHQYETAIRALQSAIKHGGGQSAELDLGRLFLSRKMWAEALVHLENSLRMQPTKVETVRLIAAAYFHLERHELAVQTYLKAYALEPAPRTLLSAAIAHHAAGAHGSALTLLKRVIPDEQAVPEVHFQRALSLIELKKVGEARKALVRYIALARGRKGEKARLDRAVALLQGSGGPRGNRATPRGPSARPTGPSQSPAQPHKH